jgi:hypothetical protein
MVQHFSSADTIENPILKKKTWSKDYRITNIAIEKSNEWTPQLTETRPGIIIKRGTWTKVRLGINDRMMGFSPTGQREFANYWQGTHTFFCIDSEAGAADVLGAEVFRELNQNGNQLEVELDMKRWTVAEIGATGRLKEAANKYVVPVSVAYMLEEAWIVQIESPLFKRVDLSIIFG